MSQSKMHLKTSLQSKINSILERKKDAEPIDELPADTSLTNDIGLESLDLAELTVKIEDDHGVDIFEDEVVDEVSEVIDKMQDS